MPIGRSHRVGSSLIFSIAAGLLLTLALAGCAGTTDAASASSLVRARATTAPETFVLQLDGATRALSEVLDKLAVLLASPRYFDDAWKSEAVNLATLVELGYRQLEGLAPPAARQEQHAAAVRAVQDCQTLTVYVFQGINNMDKGPFDEVKQRVDFCRNKLRLATSAPGSIEEESQPVSIEAARQEVHVSVQRDANLRDGPSTRYRVVATAKAGDKFTVIGRTAKGDWLQLSGGQAKNAWIAVFLVQADGDLQAVPVVTPPPAPVPLPTSAGITPPPPGP